MKGAGVIPYTSRKAGSFTNIVQSDLRPVITELRMTYTLFVGTFSLKWTFASVKS